MRSIFFVLFCLGLCTGAYTQESVSVLFTEERTAVDQRVDEIASPLSEEQKWVERVRESISRANLGSSKLNSGLLEIEGMSNAKMRHFLNNICSFPNTRYLEIGSWKGSTFVSALYQNRESLQQCIGMDDWSQFGGPYHEFQANCDRFISDVPYQFYSHDCFGVPPASYIGEKINVYFYDGAHEEKDQFDAFFMFDAVLDDVFVAIVDDWNFEQARLGTFEAFRRLGYKVVYEVSVPALFEGDRQQGAMAFYVAVIKKNG